jgi:hypothetical protein
MGARRPIEQNQLCAIWRVVFGTSDRGYLIVLVIVADYIRIISTTGSIQYSV